MVAISGGPFGGIQAPPYASGKTYIPHYMAGNGSTITTTATRIYYCNYYVFGPTIPTFSAAQSRNQGTGDSGEKFKIAVYDIASTGLPGTLLKDFGEATLDGSSGLRTLSSSWTPPRLGWFKLAIWFDSATAMYGMCNDTVLSDVGHVPAGFTALQGSIGLAVTGTNMSNYVDYVDTTYGAWASTAVTPTVTNMFGQGVPIVGLKVT